MLCVGLFANGDYGAAWNGSGSTGVKGLFYGDAGQLVAQALGAPRVRVFPGSLPGRQDRASELQSMADRLRTLGEYAEQNGDVSLVLETHDAFSTGVAVAEVLALVDHPRVGALWDLHHPYRHGETPDQTHAALAPYVQHVHVKDSRPGGAYCLPGAVLSWSPTISTTGMANLPNSWITGWV